MRRLILMRHAKSDWADAGLTDHERALTDRGERDATRMAQWLAQSNLVPEAILASTATRVRDTVERLMAAWPDRPSVYYNDDLYLASPESIVRAVRSDSLEYASVMVVAHNPGLETLASHWAHQPTSMPTAAIAVYDFDIDDWRSLSGTLAPRSVIIERPKSIP